MNKNSKTVARFSGLGAVTKILLKPYTMALERAIPRAADLPRPLPAVRLIVLFRDLSDTLSTIYMTVDAWS